MTFCVSFCVVMCLNSLIQFSFAFWIPACRASWLWAGVEVSVVGRKEAKLLDVSVGLKRILHAAWHVTHSSTAAWFPLIHVGIWIYCSVLCMYTSMLWDYNVLLKSIEGTRWKRRAEAEDLWLFFSCCMLTAPPSCPWEPITPQWLTSSVCWNVSFTESQMLMQSHDSDTHLGETHY